eukprot:2841671-Lingulodinium_polyedra.AAC.1
MWRDYRERRRRSGIPLLHELPPEREAQVDLTDARRESFPVFEFWPMMGTLSSSGLSTRRPRT